MELALADAATTVGIRLTLLDTAYFAGGIGAPLTSEQLRFGDGDAAGWLARWHSLRETLATRSDGLITLGAAIHSVRAVPPEQIAAIIAGLPGDVPLHIHLSEQPLENSDSVAAYGKTPTQLIASLGVLTRRLSVVHATHLTEVDIRLLGDAGVAVVMCPSTEADLGDGIGPALALAEAGASIAIGSDQNAVVDPLLELRGLEAGERLASGRRGRFTPAALWTAGTAAGYASLGLGSAGLAVGDPLDLVDLDTASTRTVGSLPQQLPLTATAADVVAVFVGGREIARRGADGTVASSNIGSIATALSSALATITKD
jgi:formiminoglutamate deiminase